MSTPTPPPTGASRAAVCAAVVLEGADDGPQTIGVFTDEELVALDGIATEQLVPTPWITTHADTISTEHAASVALRSLIARRLVLPAEMLANDWSDLGDDPRRLIAADPVQGLITLRRSAASVVSFHRVVQESTHTLIHYGYENGRILEEEITQDGFHHFVVLPAPLAPQRALMLVDQDEVASADGEPAIIDMDEFAEASPLSRTLADTRALTVATVIRRDTEPEQFTFYATSDALWVSRPETDAPGTADDSAPLQFIEVSRETAEQFLTEILEADAAAGADDATPSDGEN